MSKKKLRKKILAYRKKKYKNINVKYSFLQYILKKYNLTKNKNIGAYYPISYEIDSLSILKKIEKDGYKISLPITKRKNQMDFFEWSFKDPLVIGRIGVPEPIQIKKVYPDILLVPLVAFDKSNYRLGYGGGYYDRYIEKIKKIKKILTIGLAFSFQEVKKLPLNKYDKKLDYIFTDKKIKK